MTLPWKKSSIDFEDIVYVLCTLFLFVATYVLTGCASHLVSRTGPTVGAPEGFVVYCQTYPSRAECGGDQ